jgi:hypothetical protein
MALKKSCLGRRQFSLQSTLRGYLGDAATNGGLCSCKIPLHKKTEIIQNTPENITFSITLIFYQDQEQL